MSLVRQSRARALCSEFISGRLPLHTSLSICTFQCDFSIVKFMAPISKYFQVLCGQAPPQKQRMSQSNFWIQEKCGVFFVWFLGVGSYKSLNSASIPTADRIQKGMSHSNPERSWMWQQKPAFSGCGRKRRGDQDFDASLVVNQVLVSN